MTVCWYQSVCDGCVESDSAAGRTDGQPRPDGGGGDRAGGNRWGRRGAGGHQRLLAVEQRLTQSGEAFLWVDNMSGMNS